VLLSAEGVAKLADVGLATVVTNEDQTLDSVTPGTWAFAAPELILGVLCDVICIETSVHDR
jgi:serine/threonine protein kinase